MSPRVGRILLAVGLGILGLLILGRALAGLYTDILWYGELGYLSTFWRRILVLAGVRGVAALLGAVLIFLNLWVVVRHLGPVRLRRRYGNLEIAERIPRRIVLGVALAVAVLGGWWLARLQFDDTAALAVAAWLRRVPLGVSDPLFGHDLGFYIFTLPAQLAALDYLVLVLIWSLLLVAVGHVLVGGLRWEENRLIVSEPARVHLAFLVAGMVLLLGVRFWMGRYLLLLEGNGVSGSLGYTDVEARIPAQWILALLAAAAAGSLIYGAVRATLLPPVVGLGALLAGGVLIGAAYPAFIQKFRVEPNELSREAPYIAWNIQFTRRAYGLDAMERRRFPYRRTAAPDPERLEPIVNRLPLWDPEPLQRAYNETQSIFAYYRFQDVDYDRYGPPGQEQQVAVSVREFNAEGVPEGNRTWQSLRLNPEYIRGRGVVATPAHPAQGGGDPDLWLREIDPVVWDSLDAPRSMELELPSIYYGEAPSGYAVVVPGRYDARIGEPGVTAPQGVPLSSFLRVVAFAWRFGDENLLFSGEVSRDSRILFRRSVRERVEEMAPFILWDTNPLPVISEGRVVWMLDGYTVSSSYPLSRAVTLGRSRIRYLRNSVKATIDAVTGAVRLYAMDGEEPLLATYMRIFPNLFQPLASMPALLRQHLRYPEMAVLTQAEILQEYHLDDPEPFYAGRDVWQRPQETSPVGGLRDYRPTYVIMPVPTEAGVEYLTVLPFIARARQNMTAVLIARNTEDRYGELQLLEFPRDQQIPGPVQVQTMMEQDPAISSQLSLWRRGGSDVDLGHLRVIPLDSSVLYVQPLFLSAEEKPIPELRRVVVGDGINVSMGETLGAAMAGLELPVDVSRRRGAERGQDRGVEAGAGEGWPRRALELMNDAQARLREGDWSGYGRLMEELRQLLEGLSGGPGPETVPEDAR